MIRGYYFITDERLSKNGVTNDVRSAVAAGVKIIQYRNKIADTATMLKEAFLLKKICRNSAFIVNDRIDIALAVNADGVHIGMEDMPYTAARKLLGKNKIIGVTVHTLTEAITAAKKGADYLGVSPIFATATKKNAGPPSGTALIKSIKKNCDISIVAIGGINLQNAPQVVEAGADALCAISAVVTKGNVKKEIRKFQELFR
ncbi:MAG TPA: thiamine phosphate synthase [Candidatus Omnitrophota bacterium]|nr:thiamine phosphate synthase [Candidatus Omnitrophota bacterium]HPD84656.1 thiamine phosphate synthase [Candidatus Omnitrophota bacterium]HRZ03514.1 thiamine phosphate synthase [Candidatus Omnitrophota bacterium]